MKLRITIKGRVHGVGYRVKLINLALEYGIDRFSVLNAEIDGKQAVICLIDAPDEIAEIVKHRIEREKPDKAVVESISFEEYRYDVPPIERCMQAFQMEHWGKAIPILLDMRDKQDETIKVIREESEKTRIVVREESQKTREELGRKIDVVGEKVDLVAENVDRVGEKVDEVGGKVDRVGDKIDILRSDLKEYIEVNLREIHSRISEIEKALKKAGIM